MGSYKSFVSEPNAELLKYKQRVLQDGGEIINESKTLEAIKFLISNGIYGLARVFVGGNFGVKRNNNGAILKLYSLDGEDMIAYNLSGGASEHKIENGEIVFNNAVISDDGGNVGTAVSYTHLTLPTNSVWCRSRWSPYH